MAIGITAAAMFAYMYEAPPRQAVHELAQNTPAATTEAPRSKSSEQANDLNQVPPQRELSAAELADIDPASIDWEALRRSRGAKDHFDPMIRSDLFAFLDSFEFSDQEIAAYNALHVIPFNPVAEKVCTSSNKGAGTNEGSVDGTVTECTFQLQFLEPFLTVPDEELVDLAQNDPLAAAVLARRASEEGEQFIWITQAIALSGKSGPALWMAEHKYVSTAQIVATGESVPLYDSIIKRYSLESIAFELGDPRANPKKYEAIIEASFGKDSDQARQYAQSQTQFLKDRIDQIRQEAALPEIIWESNNV
jgi:hypothetical protein